MNIAETIRKYVLVLILFDKRRGRLLDAIRIG